MVGNKKIHFLLVAQKIAWNTNSMLPDPRTHTHGYGNGHRHCIFRIAYSTRGYRYPYSTSNNTQKHKSKQCCQLALFQYSMLSRFHTAVSWSVSSIRPSRHELGSPAAKIEKKERERETKRPRGNSACCSYFLFRFCSQFIMPDEFWVTAKNNKQCLTQRFAHTPWQRMCLRMCVCGGLCIHMCRGCVCVLERGRYFQVQIPGRVNIVSRKSFIVSTTRLRCTQGQTDRQTRVGQTWQLVEKR